MTIKYENEVTLQTRKAWREFLLNKKAPLSMRTSVILL
jgi:hypothetical protein